MTASGPIASRSLAPVACGRILPCLAWRAASSSDARENEYPVNRSTGIVSYCSSPNQLLTYTYIHDMWWGIGTIVQSLTRVGVRVEGYNDYVVRKAALDPPWHTPLHRLTYKPCLAQANRMRPSISSNHHQHPAAIVFHITASVTRARTQSVALD